MIMFLFSELFGGHLFDTCQFILTSQNGNTMTTSIKMYYLCILFILGIVVKSSDSSPNELCKSENGFMSLLDESKILSRSKNEKGNTTIFITPDHNKGLDETFTFICHKNENISDTKIIFESDINHESAHKSPAVLDFIDLAINEFGTNTLPYSIKCKDVCEVIVIVIEFNATVLCDEKEPKRWNCGLDQLDKQLTPYIAKSGAWSEDEENMTRIYEVQNPIKG